MKKYTIFLALLVCSGNPFAGQEKPVPPGRRELKDYQSTHIEEPPQIAAPRQNTARMQREALELAELAQTIPHEVDTASKGVLSKDALEKLRRIEKLSKQLRLEIAH